MTRGFTCGLSALWIRRRRVGKPLGHAILPCQRLKENCAHQLMATWTDTSLSPISVKKKHVTFLSLTLSLNFLLEGFKQRDLQERGAQGDRELVRRAGLPRVLLQPEERYPDRTRQGARDAGESCAVHPNDVRPVPPLHSDEGPSREVPGRFLNVSEVDRLMRETYDGEDAAVPSMNSLRRSILTIQIPFVW